MEVEPKIDIVISGSTTDSDEPIVEEAEVKKSRVLDNDL